MNYFAGLDVSLEWTSVCVVDVDGGIVREAKSTSSSSPSSVKPPPPSLSPTKKFPMRAPRWRIGVPCKVRQRPSSSESPSERM